MIDRPIRPLFPEGYLNETQIIGMVLSADPGARSVDAGHHRRGGGAGDLRYSVRARARRACASRMVERQDDRRADATTRLREAEFNIVVAGTEDGIVMVEAGGSRRAEDKVVDAIEFGHECCRKIIAGIRELQSQGRQAEARVSPPPEIDQELYDKIAAQVRADLTDAMNTEKYKKIESYHRIAELKKSVADAADEEHAIARRSSYFERSEGTHLPRRDAEEAPPSRRPRVRRDSARSRSKSACCRARTVRRFFTRGETQALVTATLGTKEDEQRIEMLDTARRRKRFMLHYNFPPFSVGEVGFMRGAGRREIGHGALAERALSAVIPDEDDVPVHAPRGQRHSRIERFELDGLGLRRNAGADGCRCADQGARRRRRDGPGEGRRQVRRPDRHRRRRRSLRRHGFQSRRHARRHHRAADGHQGRRASAPASCAKRLQQARKARLHILGQDERGARDAAHGAVAVCSSHLHHDRFRRTRFAT